MWCLVDGASGWNCVFTSVELVFCVYVADAGFAHNDGIDSVVRLQHVVCEYI